MRSARALAGLAFALSLAACGGAPGAAVRSLPPAAEPAAAPPAAHAIAGRTERVGTLPEGIVVDADAGVAVVAVRDPSALVVLDARTGRLVRRVSIPAPPRHLALAGPAGPVLVPAEPVDRLLELSLPGGTLQAIAVGVHPHAAAAVAGRVFVGNEFGASVSVIAGGKVVGLIRGFLQPGGLAAVGGELAVVDVRADTVTLVDARTLTVVGRTTAGEGPTHTVADGSRLFVADTRGNGVLSFATRPRLRPVGRFGLPGTPYGIAIDPLRRHLWVTLTAANELAELSITGQSLRLIQTYQTGQQPNTVAVDPRDGRVFVADAAAGIVQLIDPSR